MKDFVCHVATEIFFGPGKGHEFVSRILEAGCDNVLLVSGGGSVKRLGYFAIISSLLKEADISWVEFEGIEPNPLSSTVNRAAKFGAQAKVSGVVALGGGSVMDASKAISALIHDAEDDIWPFVLGEERQGQFKGALPIFAVPTTAATASEVTPFAVISNKETCGKAPLAYEFFKPRASWINPEFTVDLPVKTTQDGAADILSHVFENYLLGGSDAPLTDRYCESIIKTVVETLPLVLDDPKNSSFRGTMLWCSTLALNGMQAAGRDEAPFVLHAIEHAMSAVNHDLAHGRGLATLYPSYFRWLLSVGRAEDRLARLGREIFNISGTDEAASREFIERFEAWLRENGLLQGAAAVGISPEQLKPIAEYVVRVYGDGKTINALGEMTVDDIVSVLQGTARQR